MLKKTPSRRLAMFPHDPIISALLPHHALYLKYIKNTIFIIIHTETTLPHEVFTMGAPGGGAWWRRLHSWRRLRWRRLVAHTTHVQLRHLSRQWNPLQICKCSTNTSLIHIHYIQTFVRFSLRKWKLYCNNLVVYSMFNEFSIF